MKYRIESVIVVEGTSDSSYLSSFIDAVFVITNGYEIPKAEIAFLNNSRNTKPVIVLTDSDEAGKTIRDRLNKKLNNYLNVEVDILKCDKKHKHGVAECSKEEVINVLEEHITDETTHDYLNTSDIMELEIDKEKREELCAKLNLGICNNKTFIKRLNYLGYTKEELKKYGNQ